jgi:hypothetical protein
LLGFRTTFVESVRQLTNAAMLFFFSYARADFSPFLKRFYEDLREAVRSKAGEPNAERIAFRDAISIEPGRPWPEAITEALRACKVFVYLHTPQPVYWDGEKQPMNVPPEVARIQLTHEDYGQDYNRNGMLQISRASYGTQVYWDAVNAIARRIWTAVQNAPLPELRNSPKWDHITPLFPLAAQVQPTEPIAASRPIRPPRYARFVWIVGKRDELAQMRRVESLGCYDPDGIAEEWRPFLPDSSEPARLIATDAAREAQLGYYCERLPLDHHELQSLIERAGDAYTPVVVVSDLWSLNLDKYRAVVRVFDRGKLDNCAVIFPWNLKDHDTSHEQAELLRTTRGMSDWPSGRASSVTSLHLRAQ